MTRRIAALIVLTAAMPAAPSSAQSDTLVVQPFLRNWTRFEVWRYFEPPPGGGDPDSAHIGTRLQAGVRIRRGAVDATVALQYVQFGGLPSNAIGPGALGTGALYFDHSGDTSSHQVYLKTASIALRKLGGALDVQVGRMPFTGGAERVSGVAKVEAVKRQRIDSRLVGEFEWSLYQRAFDGVRVDWAAKSFQITGTAFRPTHVVPVVPRRLCVAQRRRRRSRRHARHLLPDGPHRAPVLAVHALFARQPSRRVPAGHAAPACERLGARGSSPVVACQIRRRLVRGERRDTGVRPYLRLHASSLRRRVAAERVLEGSIDWRVNAHYSMNAFVARASRGPVVEATFADGPAIFLYLEHVLQF